MTSRRRNSNKNLGNSISDVRRRIRYLERKPIRTKIQNRFIKAASIAPSTITAEEVDFGTTVVTNENPADVIDNPKEGLGVINPDNGEFLLFSSDQNDYIPVADANAQATADGKNTIYYQTTAPSSASLKTNDIWYDTDDGNKLYVWNGTAWVNIQDTAIAAAAAAAVAAQSTADGKNKVYRQDAQPSGGTYVSGDIWFDTDDNNKIYRYSGTAWVAVQLGGNALANVNANSITAGTIDASVITVSNITASNISTGTLAAERIAANSLDVSVLQAGTLRSGTIYTGDIVASQITSGTITGRTIRTATSGRRVEVDATNNALSFYNAAGTALGHIRPADDYSGVIISSGGSATTSFIGSSHPKMLMYPLGTDGQFSLILNSGTDGFFISSSGGVQTATIGATNTSTLATVFSLREIAFGQSSVFPDLTSINTISGIEGQIVLTYS
jgi:hypothetical protein